MEKETLRLLELLNQIALTDSEKTEAHAFFDKREKEREELQAIDTEKVERMVHVLPILTVVREDEVKSIFTREELQKNSPDTDEGYWCVPKVLE